ncbi:hypothetical protein, partial [Pseudonocardia xinjiangensis]
RVDNISPPAILMTTLYLDMYNYGLDKTIEHIKSLVQGNGIYNPQNLKPFQNLFIEVTRQGSTVNFSIGVKRLVEHENSFAFWTKENLEPQAMGISEVGTGGVVYNGTHRSIRYIKQSGPITPHKKTEIFMENVPEKTHVELYHALGNKPFLLFSGLV